MGTDIARDLIHQNHQTPEQRLWRQVLVHAFEEARLPTSDRKSSIYKMEATQWIIQDHRDFKTICWWSGWDPEHVKAQYFKAVRNGEITFTDRQVKWVKYYKKYLAVKTNKNKDARKFLRKQLEEARAVVFMSTTALVSNFIVSQQA